MICISKMFDPSFAQNDFLYRYEGKARLFELISQIYKFNNVFLLQQISQHYFFLLSAK